MATHVDNTLQDNLEDNDDQVKDLDYYMANPDEMPTDPKIIDALMTGQAVEVESSKKEEPVIETPEGDTAKASEATETPPASEGEEEVIAPIESPTGKTIPYGVLKGTREKLSQAEARANAAVEKVNALEQKILEMGSKPNGEELDLKELPKTESGEFDFDAMQEEFPDEIVNVLKAVVSRSKQLEERVTELSERDQKRSVNEQATEAETLQGAIDSVSALSDWQANDPVMWNAAVAVDKTLRNDPEWQDKSMSERFEEVAKRLGKPSSSTDEPAHNKDELDSKVNEALKSAKAKIPGSLSDIPGGAPPASSETEALDNLSVIQTASKFENMSPEKMEEYLASIGI